MYRGPKKPQTEGLSLATKKQRINFFSINCGEKFKNSKNSDFWYTSLKKNVEYGKNMKIGKKKYLTPFL